MIAQQCDAQPFNTPSSTPFPIIKLFNQYIPMGHVSNQGYINYIYQTFYYKYNPKVSALQFQNYEAIAQSSTVNQYSSADNGYAAILCMADLIQKVEFGKLEREELTLTGLRQ